MYDKWQESTYITSSIRNNEPNTEEGKNKLTLYPVGFEPTSSKTSQPGLVAQLVEQWEISSMVGIRIPPRPDIFSLSLFFFGSLFPVSEVM